MVSMVSIEPREMAYFSPPTTTIRVWMMARVRGSLMVQVEPTPSLVLTPTSPLRASILDLTTSRPTPLPDTSVTFFGRGEAREEQKVDDLLVSSSLPARE